MQILSWDKLGKREELLESPIALSIGVFDGLHIGHQKLIEAVVKNRRGALPVVLTFTRNPAQVLGSRPFCGSILTMRQRIARLEELGIACIVLIDFSLEFSKLSGKTYIRQLQERFTILKVVAGYNFGFGRGRETDAGMLKTLLAGSGVEVEIVQPTFYLDRVVSSSRIREEISRAGFAEARLMLGRDYALDLADGLAREEKGKRFAVSRSQINQVLPPSGRYAVKMKTDAGEVPGEASIELDRVSWKNKGIAAVREMIFIAKKN